jgi:hypothetical protein
METVVAVEDIKKIYGDEFKTHRSLTGGEGGQSIGYEFMEEYVTVQVANRMGPYSSVFFGGDSGRKFIIPSELIRQVELPPAIETYKPVLDKYLPNRWYYDERRSQLHFYYPELELTNSMGLKHTIYDIVVFLELYSNGSFSGHLYGKRYSFTQAELASGYTHSHLPEYDSSAEDEDGYTYHFETFCLGGASPFSNLLKSMTKRNSARELEMLLIQVEQYLKWESLEGKPFISIRDIGNKERNNTYNSSILEYNDLVKVVKFALDKLTTHDTIPIIVKKYDSFVLDPSLNTNWFFKNIELLVAKEFEDLYRGVDGIARWDEISSNYIFDNTERDTSSLYELDKQDEELIKQFNIVPRVIIDGYTQEVPTVNRLSTDCIYQLVIGINEYLGHGLVKTI